MNDTIFDIVIMLGFMCYILALIIIMPFALALQRITGKGDYLKKDYKRDNLENARKAMLT